MTSFNEYLTHGNAWLFLPAAILLGALHGLEPGHSKTMMAAFIVAIRGTIMQAVLLGVAATVSHTAIIWVLAFVGLHYSGRFDVETTEPYFQVATGVIVIGMAAWMFVRSHRVQRAATDHHQTHDHDDRPRGTHGGLLLYTGANEQMEISIYETGVPPRFRLYFYDQNTQGVMPPAADAIRLETSRSGGGRQSLAFVAKSDYLESTSDIPEPHEFQVAVQRSSINYHTYFVEEHHHTHDGADAAFQDEHEQEHAAELQKRFANQRVTTGQLILFGLTGGLLPCPSAFAVLLICLQLKQFTLGFALVLAFSLGLAITLVTVGSVAAFSVHHASKHFKGFGEFVRKLPYASCALMTLIGLFIVTQGLKHLMR